MSLRAIVIGGQTGSGKTSFSVSACEKYKGEIISADSMQIYRGMDIGTAKPTRDESARVKHHLIDILEINTKFSSADFVSMASKALDDISSRGKIPFVTGGTGLYSQMLFNSFNLDESRGDSGMRDKLLKEAEEIGEDAMYRRLERIDAQAALRVHPKNIRRVVRYLEIYYTTGKTPTEMNQVNNSGKKTYSPLYICFYASDRTVIYGRINTRVDEMFAQGLEEEAYTLWKNGLESTPTASAAIGYKELFPYFKGEIDLNTAKELIKQHSRNYAKRQQTFFKRIEGCVMVDISTQSEKCVYDIIDKYLSDC